MTSITRSHVSSSLGGKKSYQRRIDNKMSSRSLSPPNFTQTEVRGLGITEMVFSTFLFSSCIWSASVDSGITAAFFGIFSAVLYFVLAGLAILASQNLDQRRGSLVACAVLGTIGSCIFVVCTVTEGSFQWSKYAEKCWICHHQRIVQYNSNDNFFFTNNNAQNCSRVCTVPLGSLFIPILLFSIIDAALGIFIAGTACYHLYCNDPTVHQQVPVPVQQPQRYPQQLRVNYPPSTYSEIDTTTTTHQ